MKLASRFMVFLTGFASLVFASVYPATIHEASAAKIAFPPRVVWAPIGVISNLVYKVDGVVKTKNGSNQIPFTNPADLQTSAKCEVSVPSGYARTVTFFCEWKLAGPANSVANAWYPVLAPGTADQLDNSAIAVSASGVWTSSVKITWTDSNGSGECDSQIATYVGT